MTSFQRKTDVNFNVAMTMTSFYRRYVKVTIFILHLKRGESAKKLMVVKHL